MENNSLFHDVRTVELIKKYDQPAPRYTSYPTVPYWDLDAWSPYAWRRNINKMYHLSEERGISIYVHLPFCESLCTYCGCNTRITKNHDVESPYIADLLKEWGLYREVLEQEEILINELHLGGGTPTFFSPENLQVLIQGLLKGARIDEKSCLSFEAHPGNTTKAHLQTLYDMGFRRLSLGIQDFDANVQRVINRQQSEADVRRVMAEAREIGYDSINFDLIYGLPLQTLYTVERTVETALALRPDRISFYSYAHVPWLKPAQRSYREEDLPKGSEKLALYVLAKQMIFDAGYHDVGMDHFALESDALFKASFHGKLHRNFMGYTDRYTPISIGLGVSAISDSWSAFAQNVKNVEEYHSLLAEGTLPLLKGHLLSTEDLAIRAHILDLMCRGNTGLPNDVDIICRLRPLEEDGLIAIENGSVFVTQLGTAFLRNICMAFDVRMAERHLSESVFSRSV